jgi:hypothetical protein
VSREVVTEAMIVLSLPGAVLSLGRNLDVPVHARPPETPVEVVEQVLAADRAARLPDAHVANVHQSAAPHVRARIASDRSASHSVTSRLRRTGLSMAAIRATSDT